MSHPGEATMPNIFINENTVTEQAHNERNVAERTEWEK